MTTPPRRATPRPTFDEPTLLPGAMETAGLIDRLVASAAARGVDITAIGVGVPEYVSPAGIITSREVLDWDRDELRGRWPTPLLIESDVRAAAIAEQRLGIGRTNTSFLFVSIGTGISHTLVIDGEIWAGHRGEAIAIGELPVDPSSTLRPEAAATVEQQASGRAIELATSGRDGLDPAAAARTSGRVVAAALSIAVRLLDPGAIVLGGGLGLSAGPFFDAVTTHYRKATEARANPPPILRSPLGKEGPVIGAGLAAIGGLGEHG